MAQYMVSCATFLSFVYLENPPSPFFSCMGVSHPCKLEKKTSLRNRGLWIWFVRIQLATPVDWWWLIPGWIWICSSQLFCLREWRQAEKWLTAVLSTLCSSWMERVMTFSSISLILTFLIPCSLMHYSGFVRTGQRPALHPEIFSWGHCRGGRVVHRDDSVDKIELWPQIS